MASTIALAASFQVDPEKLESWAKGDKPTDKKELKVFKEIFSQFQFIDGEWSQIQESTPKKAKTTKTKDKKKTTKKAASTTNSEAASSKYNNDSIVPEKETAAVVEDTNIEENTSSNSSSDTETAAKTKDTTTQKTEEKSVTTAATDTKDSTPGAKPETVPEDDKTAAKKDSDNKDKSSDSQPEDETNKVHFSAIGIIRGEVTFDDVENQHTVKVAGKTYKLFYARKNYTAFTGLKKEIAATGNSTQRLIVYPKFTHFPRKEEPPRVGFQLVGFDKGQQPDGITGELKENEFKLCGIWQFIPVCRQPCISIFRNFNRDRLDYIKQAEVQSKVNFMKASHLPILWRDGPVRPFRFNPRLEKDQQAKTYFVQIKAKFLPQRDCFGFSEMLGEPIDKPPKFLKASKADKAEVMKKVAKNRPPGKGKPPGRGKLPARAGNKPSGPRKVINKPVGKSAPSKQQ